MSTTLQAGQITYQTRIIDVDRDEIITRTAWPTRAPGLAVSRAYHPCPARDGKEACWILVHVRSGQRFPFCWDSIDGAEAFADRAAELGRWDVDEAAVSRRCALLWVQRRLTRDAYDLGAWPHQGPSGTTGLDNPLPAEGQHR
ncbi:MAG TPA: hypothetical protein VKY91_03000 [Vulgatibacteraceae bacterium]|nr:hypothetical protein [Vulgatibacteraceae bacterium]